MRLNGRGQLDLEAFRQLLRAERHRSAREGLEQRLQLARQRGLVECDAERAVLEAAQVDPALARPLEDGAARGRVGPDPQRVEERERPGVEPQPPQPELQHARERVHAARDPQQALGPVVDGVHRGHHREQHLRGADVARGLVAPDVLLARLQREPVGGLALGVLRDTHQAARQVALVLVAQREERGVRPAVSERHAEALRRPERDVGAHLAGRRNERERQEIGRDRDQRPRGVGALRERAEVAQHAVRRRVLDEHAEQALRLEVEGVDGPDVHLDAERLGARRHHRDRLRVAVRGDEEAVASRLRDGAAERHRLGGGRRLVEQRRVRERQPGEVGHHGLEVEERLQPALCDLGLVGRVLRVPARVLEHVPEDHGRRVAVGVAHADERAQQLVLPGLARELRERLLLADRERQREGALQPDRRGHRLRHQLVERAEPQLLQHRPDLGLVRADVAVLEVGRRLQPDARGGGRFDRRQPGLLTWLRSRPAPGRRPRPGAPRPPPAPRA